MIVVISDVRLMRLCCVSGSVLFVLCSRNLLDGSNVLIWNSCSVRIAIVRRIYQLRYMLALFGRSSARFYEPIFNIFCAIATIFVGLIDVCDH